MAAKALVPEAPSWLGADYMPHFFSILRTQCAGKPQFSQS
jgi:hypothetical protein